MTSSARIPVLETQRLGLRPFTPDDEPALFALACDPEVARFVRFEVHRTPAETRAFLDVVQQHYDHGNPFAWAIVLRDCDRLIGSCGFVNVAPERKSAEIGYWLGRLYWGRGYAVEAARSLLKYGFEVMGLEQIEAKCFLENAAGLRVIEKLGMEFAGTDRSEMIKEQYPELRLYSISRAAWLGKHDLENRG